VDTFPPDTHAMRLYFRVEPSMQQECKLPREAPGKGDPVLHCEHMVPGTDRGLDLVVDEVVDRISRRITPGHHHQRSAEGEKEGREKVPEEREDAAAGPLLRRVVRFFSGQEMSRRRHHGLFRLYAMHHNLQCPTTASAAEHEIEKNFMK